MKNLVNTECYCEWPNKENKKVMVISVDDTHASVIWNDSLGDCVSGFEDIVPLKWLYIPYTALKVLK
jgi:hypothetical protein